MSYWSVASGAYASWPLQDTGTAPAITAEVGPAATIAGGKTAAVMTTTGPGGWLPRGLAFDGSNDYLLLASDFPTYPSWALEAWFRYDNFHDGTLIELRQNNSARLGVSSAGLLIGAVNDGTNWNVARNAVPAGQWQHAVVVWDGTQILSYINGTLVGSPVACLSQRVNYDDPDQIARAGWGAFLLAGSLAGVRVHPALLASQVAELYAGPEPTIVESPGFNGVPVAGQTIPVSTGVWDTHGNGSIAVATTVQSSLDGVSAWQDVPGSVGASSFLVPTDAAGAYLRVSAVATNLGGDSESAVGQPVQVFPSSYLFGAVATEVAQSGAVQGSVVPTSAAVARSLFSVNQGRSS